MNWNEFKLIETHDKRPRYNFETYLKDMTMADDVAVKIPEEIIVVDFDDNLPIALKVLEKYPTLAIQTTRGAHLYYTIPQELKSTIKNTTKNNTVIGCPVDYKTGNNKTKALAVIKQKGEVRKILNDVDQLNDIPELPKLLYPMPTSTYLFDLKEGDGRNSELFKHLIMVMEKWISNNIELYSIVDFINKYVFTDRLSDKEAYSIVESVIKKFKEHKDQYNLSDVFTDDKFDIYKLTKYVIGKWDVRLYEDYLYYKKNNKYNMDTNLREIQREVAKEINLKKRDDAELYHQLIKTAPIEKVTRFPILCRNGWTINNSDIMHLDQVFTPFNLDVDYDPQAYDKYVDDFLNFLTLNRTDIRQIIEDLLGHCLITKGFPQKVFFLVGANGNNGKSTFLTMLNNFFGNLASALSLEDFKQNYNLFELNGKLVNLGDDIDASHMDTSRNFKTLAAGNTIMAKQLYRDPVKITNTATLIFTCNDMPTFTDKSGGIGRRILIIPCDANVTTPDLNIDDKLSTDNAKSYLLNLAIKGMLRIYINKKISESTTVQKQVDEYITSSDGVLQFLDEIKDGNIPNINDLNNVKTIEAYSSYKLFCIDAGINSYSKSKFSRRLVSLGYDIKVIKENKKNYKIYMSNNLI